MVEYGLIIALMAVVLITILTSVGQDSIAIIYKTIAYRVENVEQGVTNASN